MITVFDVAEKAGVSITTVSRVLNDSEHKVNRITKEKVLRIVKELDYRPNILAKSLLTNRSMTIGIIIPDISNPYYAEIVRGIQDKADTEGYSVLIQNTDLRDDRIIRSIYDFRDKHVDGVIFAGGVFRIHKYRLIMKDLVSRAVVIGRCRECFPAIRIDNVGAASMAVEYLVKLGHRRIAFVSRVTASSTMVDRIKGYKKTMTRLGFSFEEGYLRDGSLTLEEGFRQIKELLTLKKPPSAVILGNDQMAFGAVKAIREAGMKIPEDIAIMGFDNVQLCDYFDPPITSIDIPRHKMGYAAMDLLLDLIEKRTTETTRWFNVNIVARASTQRE